MHICERSPTFEDVLVHGPVGLLPFYPPGLVPRHRMPERSGFRGLAKDETAAEWGGAHTGGAAEKAKKERWMSAAQPGSPRFVVMGWHQGLLESYAVAKVPG